jgi:hypothetical protein
VHGGDRDSDLWRDSDQPHRGGNIARWEGRAGGGPSMPDACSNVDSAVEATSASEDT